MEINNNTTNKTEKKLKYITNEMIPLNTRSSLNYSNIDYSENTSQKNDTDISNALLSRQIIPVTLYGSDIEKKIRNPEDCSKNMRSYDINQVIGHSSNSLNPQFENNKKSNYSMINSDNLLTQKELAELQSKYNNTCSIRKKDLNWADYMMSTNIKGGRGFGNPENYHQTHLGIDTRIDNNRENIRNIDLSHHSIIPLDGFRINYANIPYEQDIRYGISTRTSKRVVNKN